MWREYTRETPARPGWALVASILALAGTTGLAYFVTTTRAEPAGRPSDRVSLRGWPIAFALPRGFKQVSPTDPGEELYSTAGTRGDLHATHGEPPDVEAIVSFHFRVQDEPVLLRRAFTRWTHKKADDADAIKIGPMDGLALITEDRAGRIHFDAVAVLPDYLVIAIEQVAPAASSKARRQFEALCESVQFKQWTVRGSSEWP